MSSFDQEVPEPKLERDFLYAAGIIDEAGNVNREGLVAAFARLPVREYPDEPAEEGNPFERMTREELAQIIMNPDTPIETILEIKDIAEKRFTQESLPPAGD